MWSVVQHPRHLGEYVDAFQHQQYFQLLQHQQQQRHYHHHQQQQHQSCFPGYVIDPIHGPLPFLYQSCFPQPAVPVPFGLVPVPSGLVPVQSGPVPVQSGPVPVPPHLNVCKNNSNIVIKRMARPSIRRNNNRNSNNNGNNNDKNSINNNNNNNGSNSSNNNNNSNKQVTSFSIRDILKTDGISCPADDTPPANTDPIKPIVRPWGDIATDSFKEDECDKNSATFSSATSNCSNDHTDDGNDDDDDDEEISIDDDTNTPPSSAKSACPLDALLMMANRTTFDRNSDDSMTGYDSDGGNQFETTKTFFARSHHHNHSLKKRRKTRTAFTNQQIFQLEKRFHYQKYLTPSDRDEIALTLHLSNSQVITWFQNRRAKLKRDLEELKADVTAAKALGAEPSSAVLNRLEELMRANDHGLKKKEKSSNNLNRINCHTVSSNVADSYTNDDIVTTTVPTATCDVHVKL